MAYMSQQKKALIAAELKKVVPASWKYTLAVRRHSTIVMTIASAPIDLLNSQKRAEVAPEYTKVRINEYHLERHFEAELLETFRKILRALNHGNHNNSDPMTDYFDVGHYVDLSIGRWDKPFVVTPKPRLRFINGKWKRAA